MYLMRPNAAGMSQCFCLELSHSDALFLDQMFVVSSLQNVKGGCQGVETTEAAGVVHDRCASMPEWTSSACRCGDGGWRLKAHCIAHRHLRYYGAQIL